MHSTRRNLLAILAATLLGATAASAAAAEEVVADAAADAAADPAPVAAPDAAAEESGSFRDPEDGALDVSSWLLERKGVLPMPVLISEPAIGYGGAVATLFFRGSLGEKMASGTPPDIYGAVLGGTDNGTRMAALFGMTTFGGDNWRWRGGLGQPDINIDFYGIGSDLGGESDGIAYNLEGLGSTQQLMRRVGKGGNFLGARWIWLDLESRFAGDALPPPVAERARSATNSGLGLFYEHDSRDNFFTASKGWKGFLEAMAYSPDFGGDHEFQTYRANAFGYRPVGESLVLGGRADYRAARGDVPFYQMPYIEMRGIPAARYQDENVALLEAELRWNATPRWSYIGFTGIAKAWGAVDDFGSADTASTFGVGVRRLIARRLGMYVGLDVARGPEETAIYIQAGSAWR